MTQIRIQEGNAILKDGKVGTEQACCCPRGDACCLPNGTCTNHYTSQEECESHGGTYFTGIPCGSADCAACCCVDGTVRYGVDQEQCEATSGGYYPPWGGTYYQYCQVAKKYYININSTYEISTSCGFDWVIGPNGECSVGLPGATCPSSLDAILEQVGQYDSLQECQEAYNQIIAAPRNEQYFPEPCDWPPAYSGCVERCIDTNEADNPFF